MSLPFPDRELHGIPDNLNTHKKCERWLKKHPNVHFHPAAIVVGSRREQDVDPVVVGIEGLGREN